MSKLAIRVSMLTVCATALVAVPTVTPAKAEAGGKHVHFNKHKRHWRHHVNGGWQVRPVIGAYRQDDGPVCPGIGRSFDCKIWPPPYADDPDRKTSRF
jgi:hypothetical protein